MQATKKNYYYKAKIGFDEKLISFDCVNSSNMVI